MTFEVVATDGQARAGVLHTPHGDVPTPAFMPVGTKATVKGVHPEELQLLGVAILLGNTYHLHFRPGVETIAELGGLHAFMGWDAPILTDSGGFQVFSLRHTILALDDEGVAFRSVYDGEAARLSPERAARIQAQLGSDVAMCLDVCPPAGVTPEELAEAVRLTTLWAQRQREADRPPGQLRFGMFDCVLPTRLGRTGSALTWSGRCNLRNAGYARDPRPLDESCSCPACAGFSRAYLRHLVNQQELLGLRLLSLHNLHFVCALTAAARSAVCAGRLADFRRETLERLAGEPEEAVCHPNS